MDLELRHCTLNMLPVLRPGTGGLTPLDKHLEVFLGNGPALTFGELLGAEKVLEKRAVFTVASGGKGKGIADQLLGNLTKEGVQDLSDLITARQLRNLDGKLKAAQELLEIIGVFPHLNLFEIDVGKDQGDGALAHIVQVAEQLNRTSGAS